MAPPDVARRPLVIPDTPSRVDGTLPDPGTVIGIVIVFGYVMVGRPLARSAKPGLAALDSSYIQRESFLHAPTTGSSSSQRGVHRGQSAS